MNEKLLLRKPALIWVNEYYEKDDYVLLKVFRKDLSESYDVLIDKEDFDKVSQGQWYVSIYRKNTHLKNIIHIYWTQHSKNKKRTYDIYQWMLDTKNKDIIVDHINMDRLDNRRRNLRFVTPQENRINQENTGWCFKNDKYYTYICSNRHTIHLGIYDTKEEAENIYLKACIIMGYDKISTHVKNNIKRLNIQITEKDKENVFLNRLLHYKNTGEYQKFIRDKNNTRSHISNKTSRKLSLGYHYETQTKKYLVRIRIEGKDINIGRYDTEKEANEIYLKACIISNKNNNPIIQDRINEYKIIITEKDYENKYLKKVYNLVYGINEGVPNGKFNYAYNENMDTIIKLVQQNYSWYKIAKYLKENIKGLEGAKGETAKNKYLKYIESIR